MYRNLTKFLVPVRPTIWLTGNRIMFRSLSQDVQKNVIDLQNSEENQELRTKFEETQAIVFDDTKIHSAVPVNVKEVDLQKQQDKKHLQQKTFQIQRKERAEAIIAGIQTFKKLRGHAKVPEGFVVAMDDLAYPVETRGLKLGLLVASVRRSGYLKDYRKTFEQLGVNFTVHTIQRHSFESILAAIHVFKSIYGHARVPENYEIPYTGDYSALYPTETHGMKLGDTVSSIRHKGTFREYRDRLEGLGLAEPARRPPFETIFEALLSFKLAYGHVRVPFTYEVEVGDVDFPASAWGMKLGSKVKDMRYKGAFKEQQHRLIAIGLDIRKHLQ